MAENHPAALILAAGSSSRFGSIKALAPWGGSNLLSHIIQLAQTVCPEQVSVVTGAHAQTLVPFLGGVQVIHNHQWSQGMGSSLASGVRVLEALQPLRILLLLVDQPLVTTDHLHSLLQTSFAEDQTILSSNGQYTSPPACLHPRDYLLARELTGDRGLKSMARSYGTVFTPEVLADADTASEFLELRSCHLPT